MRHAIPAAIALAIATLSTTPVAVHAGGYVEPITPMATPDAPITPQAYGWGGLYVGATLGYGCCGDDRLGIGRHTPAGSVTAQEYNAINLRPEGAYGGLRVGYRYEISGFILAPELAYETGLSHEGDFPAVASFASGHAKSDVRSMLGLRLKAGMSLDNQTYVYGIAGGVRAKVDYTARFTGGTPFWGEYTTTGHVLGLGVERQLTPKLALTIEYEHVNLGTERLTAPEPGSVDTLVTNATPKWHAIKFGLNYRF